MKRPLRPLRPLRVHRAPAVVLPAPRYPHALELAYGAELQRQYVDPATVIIRERFLALVERIAGSARADAAIEDVRFVSDIDALIAATQFRLTELVSIPDVKATAAKAGRQVDAFNSTEIRRTVERIKPVDPFRANPKLKAAQDRFTVENVKLIESIPATYLDRVGAMVKSAVATSTRAGALSKQLLPLVKEGLQAEAGICQRRAMTIARTEIAKQFGALTQIRQQAAGVESYTWATAGDDRVRPTHRANNGKVFKWSEPPATGHPGSEFQCRCVAVAVI